jgi:carboxymethylenebutenolidase
MNQKKSSNLITWLKRIGLGLLVLLALIVMLFAGTIIFDGLFGSDTADFANIEYTDAAGQELVGYLAAPDGPGPHPAILLIHEWWGLNEGIMILADALAEEGYLVLAPDGYRGQVADTIPRALWLRLTTPTEQVEGDMDSSLAHLLSLDDVDADRAASMGFCFGGGHSLQLGLRQSENLALTIIYYGALVTDPDLLRPLTDGQPVLGIFAEEDNTIFPEEVLEFEAALNSLNIENEITIYPGVGHAFINENNYDQPGPAGDAWAQTLLFLEENLMGNN